MSRPSEYFGRPADPSTRSCDWCEKPAHTAWEIFRPRKKVGTAQYLYACKNPHHEELASEASRAPRAAA